jgi:hypothetical protein
MAKKIMAWKPKGMNKDLSVSVFSAEFVFNNRNLRLSTNENNTLLSWVNEKGTQLLTVYEELENGEQGNTFTIEGNPIGTAVINHWLILFTHGEEYDYIYKLRWKDIVAGHLWGKIICKSICSYMNLDLQHPLETLTSYESDNIQKVYWVDGKNQPRIININNDYGEINTPGYCAFDFIPELQLQEEVAVTKIVGCAGKFHSGVIQYALTYYNKSGQETSIFYTSPLLYISYTDRGANPEENVDNAFKISIHNVDKHFDFIRIYSIQRTSIDATPYCKRIQDISIRDLKPSETSVSYTDLGYSGDTVDPTELLYKGGEEITADTIEQKDNTLFLGNIKYISQMNELALDGIVKNQVSLFPTTREFEASVVAKSGYSYANQLTAYTTESPLPEDSQGESTPCGGFKFGEYYRLGVQLQYKTGKWSKPIFIEDYLFEKGDLQGTIPKIEENTITIPIIKGVLTQEASSAFMAAGYKKIRGIYVPQNIKDRQIICQGVVNPTLYTQHQRETDKNIYAQSSWFFRFAGEAATADTGAVFPAGVGDPNKLLPYDSDNPNNPALRHIEIQGKYSPENQFRMDNSFVTYHSPDIEFDKQLFSLDFTGVSIRQVGNVIVNNVFSDIEIQTETATISNTGSGFVHKSFQSSVHGIVSGLFWDDFIVEDWNEYADVKNNITELKAQKSSAKWMVYLWNKTGALNNDINRPADRGNMTAKLKKKVISNLRYTDTLYSTYPEVTISNTPQLFRSDQISILKFTDNDNTRIYQGNIDTALLPDNSSGQYFAFQGSTIVGTVDIVTTFTSGSWWKTDGKEAGNTDERGLYKWNTSDSSWFRPSIEASQNIGNQYLNLVLKKDLVRMKYKSTPHLVFDAQCHWGQNYTLPVIEITRTLDSESIYGGQSTDAFLENKWIPCGKAVCLNNSEVTFHYAYGDTYYQRWDCLKTYPFTFEDLNQVVEIGSFMLETRVNIDGRYDRNRGQLNNLNMHPANFNLINPVYSQLDNFFTYRILDNDSYTLNEYPNEITWTKTKENGADVDLWTNITLASSLDLDGNKGEVRALRKINDTLLAFQDSGICQILYNENMQISTTEGVPIEIANSGKVQGKRYVSDNIGCSNKWSITDTPKGIYFIDSNEKSIYLFNGQLQNISTALGFNSWTKKNIPAGNVFWNPVDFENFVSYYDKLNQDILWINQDDALALSEKFDVFTSFYDYGNTPFFINLDDAGVWIRSDGSIWQHRGNPYYCSFFGDTYPYEMTLVGNPDPQVSKIFTNIEFRACVDTDGVTTDGIFIPHLPFDFLTVKNEYQFGRTALSYKHGKGSLYHHTKDNDSTLKRKFRSWRCDIPRDQNSKNKMDRMNNPWVYLTLEKKKDTQLRTEIHDLIMTYFD